TSPTTPLLKRRHEAGQPTPGRLPPGCLPAADAEPGVHAEAFARRGACHVLAGIVVARGDGGRVVPVAEVAQFQPALPASAGRIEAEAAAEDHVAVGAEAVGVIHE